MAKSSNGGAAVSDAVPGGVTAPNTNGDSAESAGIYVDVQKRAAETGNIAALELTSSQRAEYDELVKRVKDQVVGMEKSAFEAWWHIGDAIQTLKDDQEANAGTKYGNATVDGFAVDAGISRSKAYKALRARNAIRTKASLNRILKGNVIGVDVIDVIAKKSLPDPVKQAAVDAIEKRGADAIADGGEPTVLSTDEAKDIVSKAEEEHYREHPEEKPKRGSKDSGGSRQASDTPPRYGENSLTNNSHKRTIATALGVLEKAAEQLVNLDVSAKEIPEDHNMAAADQVAMLVELENSVELVDTLINTSKVVRATLGKVPAARAKLEKAVAEEEKAAKAEAKAKKQEAEKAKKAKAAEKAAAAKAKKQEAEKAKKAKAAEKAAAAKAKAAEKAAAAKAKAAEKAAAAKAKEAKVAAKAKKAKKAAAKGATKASPRTKSKAQTAKDAAAKRTATKAETGATA